MIGTTIKQRYAIEDKLGSGAMGDVYRATDTQTGERVAIKAIKPELLGPNSDLLERFEREGEALRDLNHPNIVRLQEVIHADDGHYLVMEYVGGGDLSGLLKQADGKPSIKQILSIALDLADALTRAHRLEIVHRDLKPANVLIAGDGTPRLSDFGIALTTGQDRLTDSRAIIGTMDYIAPEVINGLGVDTRSDVWSFGVMLFEMLAGQRPFRGEPLVSLLASILNDPVPDLEDLRPDCPVALVDLVYRMLEKDVMARIPSVRHVGAELEDILFGRSTPPSEPRFEEPSTERLIPPSTNLPVQTTPFIGRTEELETVGRLIDEGSQRLITILGPGGMGKSRLSIEIGERHGGSFEDGVFFVELAKLKDAANIPAAIAEAVHYTFTDDGTVRDQIINFLGNKHMLLILDNFEHIIEGRDLVTEILHAAAQVTVLTTSRERLNLSDEVVFNLDGMDFPEWETPEDALHYSAVQLFMSVAQRVNPEFTLRQDDLDYLIRICRLVEGVPLGITLAGAWLDTLKMAEIAEEITQSVDILESEMADLPARQRSMRAVFDYSWALLIDEERDAYARMSVLRGSCTRQAAQKISGATLRMLNTLVNKSLLRRDPDSGRFHIHELLRQIGEEYLEASGAADSIRDTHSAYYLEALAEREADLKGRDQLGGLDDIEADFENIRAAWHWAVEHGQIDRIRTCLIPLSLFARMRSRQDDCRALFNLIGELPDDPYIIYLMTEMTNYHTISDRESAQKLKDIGAHYEAAGETLLAGIAYLIASWRLISLLGQRLSDDDAPQRALSLLQEAGDDFFLGLANAMMSSANFRIGAWDKHEEFNRVAGDIQRRIGDRHGLIMTLNNASTARTGDWTTAEQHFLEVYRLGMELRAGAGVIWPLVNAANVGLAAHGDLAVIEERLNTALGLALRYNSPRNIAYAAGMFVAVKTVSGQIDEAERYFALAQENNRDAHVAVNFAIDVAGGTIGSFQKDYDRTRGHFVPHLERTVNFGDTAYKFWIVPMTIWLLSHDGRHDLAAEMMGHAMTAERRPAGWFDQDPVLQRTADELTAAMGEDAYQAAYERGRDLDLLAVLQTLLDEIKREGS